MSGKISVKTNLKLTHSQETFARAYTAYGEETFCNGYLSLIRTREFKGSRESAYSYASQLKSHHAVQARIRELVEASGFNDLDVDGEHLKVIKQDKDMTNKIRAIAEYNKLKGRGTTQSAPVVVNIIDFQTLLQDQEAAAS